MGDLTQGRKPPAGGHPAQAGGGQGGQSDGEGQHRAEPVHEVHVVFDVQRHRHPSRVGNAVEAATERVDLKFRIFSDLDRIAKPDAILATNTSSISITQIAAQTKRPEKVIGMHFMNPVPVMQLVEVIRGIATADETYAAVDAVARRMGKTPVEVKDSPGFVSNRVLMPLINS